MLFRKTLPLVLSAVSALRYDDNVAIRNEVALYRNRVPYMVIDYSTSVIGTKEVRKSMRLTFDLFYDLAPRTCLNFAKLLEGKEKDASGTSLAYKGSKFHRIIHGFVMQGGDFTNGNGTGGRPVFEGLTRFNDENFEMLHVPGVLSMANAGANTNGSQFFITLGTFTHLDGKHVVFGKLKDEVQLKFLLAESSQILTSTMNDKPAFDVVIVDCGLEGEDKAVEPESMRTEKPEVL